LTGLIDHFYDFSSRSWSFNTLICSLAGSTESFRISEYGWVRISESNWGSVQGSQGTNCWSTGKIRSVISEFCDLGHHVIIGSQRSHPIGIFFFLEQTPYRNLRPYYVPAERRGEKKAAEHARAVAVEQQRRSKPASNPCGPGTPGGRDQEILCILP
jgi:hypothetical protein